MNYSGFIKRTIQNIHERVRGNKLGSKLTKQLSSKIGEGTDKSQGFGSSVPLSPKKQNLSYMEKVDLSQLQESGLMDEIDQVQIQHTIIAVFINTEEAKQQGINENETP